MYCLKKVLLFLGILTAISLVSPSSDDINPGTRKISPVIKQESEWRLLGQIGRKTYYTNNNVTNGAATNWFAARNRCDTAGLQFADFQSQEEFRFVRSKLPVTIKLWVSASLKGMEEYNTQQNFVWSDGSNVNTNISFYHFPNNWICLLFSSDDHLYTDSCLEGMYGTLCQFVL